LSRRIAAAACWGYRPHLAERDVEDQWALRLVESQVTGTGAILASYAATEIEKREEDS
jgi:hypothetical protein